MHLNNIFPGKGKSTNLLGDHHTRFSIEMMCKIFKATKSSYYCWLKEDPSNRWKENETLLVGIMEG
jgi:hypothetical protein